MALQSLGAYPRIQGDMLQIFCHNLASNNLVAPAAGPSSLAIHSHIQSLIDQIKVLAILLFGPLFDLALFSVQYPLHPRDYYIVSASEVSQYFAGIKSQHAATRSHLYSLFSFYSYYSLTFPV
ncbi:MAG: hypothetical protein S4CHLAM102_07450 [Chlamydiia bacterium]|nr:hypothetical protein [Chlamydiia bacterium]